MELLAPLAELKMNEFTKEELEWLSFELGWTEECGDKLLGGMYKKLQSMIDNYCEHEKVVPNWGPNTECDKCGEIW